MGLSFSYEAGYMIDPNLSKEEVEKIYDDLDISDLNFMFTDGHYVQFYVSTYGSYSLRSEIEEKLKETIKKTVAPNTPVCITCTDDESDAGKYYEYVSVNPIHALKMELIDLDIQIKNLRRDRARVQESINALESTEETTE